ncbi:MAG TPA: class I SAM-dependent methyltransferase [Gaiellaceae bacterium]|nr:class I SAM-dependent methyltransferase [Gaiellaceae bacterium]
MWSRVFALAYDPFLAAAERRGLARERARLLGTLHGRILEIGAGTGLNVPHYPPDVHVVYTEPDPHMAARLRRRGVEVVEAGAEALPFADASFDFVVSTLVLCTVPDVPATLAEVRRVLEPGGELVLIEHVRAASGTSLERWQDRLHGPWHAFACGCHCNRDLGASLAAADFTADVEPQQWRFMPRIVRPVVSGSATPS